MNYIIVITIIWNITPFVFIRSHDSVKIRKDLKNIVFLTNNHYQNSEQKNNRFTYNDPVAHNSGKDKMNIAGGDTLEAGGPEGLLSSKVSRPGGNLAQQDTVRVKPSSLWTYKNSLATLKTFQRFGNSRQKRSAGAARAARADALKDMHGIISHLQANEDILRRYGNFVDVFTGLHEQLKGTSPTSIHEAYLKNMLATFMKHKFDMLARKRNPVGTKVFDPWGGRRKKSVETAGVTFTRGTRPFNAWGGKRSKTFNADSLRIMPFFYEDEENLVDTDGAVKEDNEIRIPSPNTNEREFNFFGDIVFVPGDEKLSSSYTELLGEPEEQYENMLFLSEKRQGFNAWGGKRGEYTTLA